ncbi:MAG: translation initiation factor [Gammaproteobacteria bacterium]|nr:translation initiation factor [Gammaproteobacteria bacterium]
MFLIGATGEKIGVTQLRDALNQAQAENLDLVEISPNGDPPVCRIMDFGKYRFEQSKKQMRHKRKLKQVQLKELKMRPGTDIGDYQVKMRKAVEFLKEGDKVKFTVRFRGREISFQNLGAEMLERIQKDLEDIAVVEQRSKMEGRQMVMIVGPKKSNSERKTGVADA